MDFIDEVNKLYLQLGESGIIVLATCEENKPTARAMSYVVKNNNIYFQTNQILEKAKQMEHNPNVSLCQNNISIQGIALNKGGVLDKINLDIMTFYKQKHKGSYDAYSHMEGAVLYEVTPGFVTFWIYKNGEPYRKYIDFVNKKVWEELYDHSK